MIKIAVMLNLDWPLKRYHKLYDGIRAFSEEQGNWQLMWDPFPEVELQKHETPYYDGMIGRCKYDSYDAAQRLNIPVVSTWYSNDIKGLPLVSADYEAAGRMAAKNMIKRGYKNFVSINYKEAKIARPFNKGIKTELEEFGYHLNCYNCPRDLEKNKKNWQRFNDSFKQWSKNWQLPLVVLTSISDIGPKITALCRKYGLSVPEQVAVVSSGNDITYCEGLSPTISSIDIDYFKVGYEAANLLDLKIKNIKTSEDQIKIPPSGFISRETTDSYAITDTYVLSALRFIANNYQENISVEDVSNHVPVSRRYLEMRFVESTGITIFDEINRLRIDTAKRLLKNPDLSLKEISVISGFSSAQHLRRAFTKVLHMNPSEFRKQMRR